MGEAWSFLLGHLMPRGWSFGKRRASGYRSGAEEKLAEWLTKNKIEFEYETIKLVYEKPVRSGLCKECGKKKVVKLATYTPDFIINNGKTLIEYKGRLTQTDRAKLLAVRRANPERDLRLLFGSDNRLVKNSDKRYSTWCVDNGIDYAIGVPPAGWLTSL